MSVATDFSSTGVALEIDPYSEARAAELRRRYRPIVRVLRAPRGSP